MPRGQQLATWLKASGSVAHTSTVYERGFTKRDVAAAVAEHGVTRIRRSWLTLLPPTNPTRRAVAVGGRLTCVSEAERMGLWVPRVTETHVWVPSTASRFDPGGLRVHRSTGPSPVAVRSCREPLLNVLFHVAQCLPEVEALTVWESALRKTAITKEMLQEVAWSSVRARLLSDAAGGLSDSGLETYVVVRLRRTGLAVQQQIWIDDHPVDALVGERLIIQVDGKHHLDPRQRRRDIAGDARLVLMGYTVLRFDYKQVMFDWPRVESIILMAVAQGRHL